MQSRNIVQVDLRCEIKISLHYGGDSFGSFIQFLESDYACQAALNSVQQTPFCMEG